MLLGNVGALGNVDGVGHLVGNLGAGRHVDVGALGHITVSGGFSQMVSHAFNNSMANAVTRLRADLI